MTAKYDMAVIGGGIMGCATALRMVEGGMRAVILDQGDLGQGASGSCENFARLVLPSLYA